MDQFEKYESLYFNLSKKDQYFIEDTTGCLYPCSYPEYRVGAKKVFNLGSFGLYISYGSLAVTVKKEVIVKSAALQFIELHFSRGEHKSFKMPQSYH